MTGRRDEPPDEKHRGVDALVRASDSIKEHGPEESHRRYEAEIAALNDEKARAEAEAKAAATEKAVADVMAEADKMSALIRAAQQTEHVRIPDLKAKATTARYEAALEAFQQDRHDDEIQAELVAAAEARLAAARDVAAAARGLGILPDRRKGSAS